MGVELIYNRTMKRILSSVCPILVILAIAGIANVQDTAIKRVPAKMTASVEGKALFREYCAVCHGVDGKGGGPAAAALKQSPGDLTQLARFNGAKFPEDRVLGVIKGTRAVAAHGTQDMPMWGTIFENMGSASLAQTRVYALLQYIDAMQVK